MMTLIRLTPTQIATRKRLFLLTALIFAALC